MAERLLVLFDQQLVGFLDRDNGVVSFTYAPEVIRQLEGRILISASLRVRSRPFTQTELLPFFAGLLPEGESRQRLATQFRLDYNDVFGLLRELGRECAGALSIVPEGIDLAAIAQEGVDWLDEASLTKLVMEMGTRPLGVDPERDIRISLAGVQTKTVLVVAGTRMGLPRGTTPSTHILKPAPREQFPDLVSNEAFCMRLARLAGLNVSDADVIQIGGSPALLVRRYDRENQTDRVKRIHQEDFCQALRVPSDRKYQADGGPDLRRMVDLLNRVSSDVGTDVDEFISRIGFNFLIGNADAHAKNFSLLYSNGPRLAPAYDLISTELYPNLTKAIATSIGGEYRPQQITADQWKREFVRLDLNFQRYAQRLAELADRVLKAIREAHAWLEQQGAAAARLDAIAEIVETRAKTLRLLHD